MTDILAILIFGILWIEVCELRTIPDGIKIKSLARWRGMHGQSL